MTSRIKDIPGYVILGSIVLLGLAAWGIYGAAHLFTHKSDFERLTSYKNVEEMLAADRAFREQVDQRILELGESGAILKKAESGDAEAQYLMGNIYLYGIKGITGTATDSRKAANWFRRALGQGNAAAAYQIGAMYLNGYGVKSGRAEALKWYRKAAEGGDGWAQRHLGELYLSILAEEFGVQRDFPEAYFWLALGTAGLNPRENYVEHRDSAKANLTAEQFLAVNKRLKAWKPNPGTTDCKNPHLSGPTITLTDFWYMNPDEWRMKLNGREIKLDDLPLEIIELQLEPNAVHMKWFNTCGIMDVTLHPGEQFDDMTGKITHAKPAPIAPPTAIFSFPQQPQPRTPEPKCASGDTACNPFDTPENRAIMNKKQ